MHKALGNAPRLWRSRRRRRWRCRRLRATSSASRTRRSSATSARARCRSTTCTTSRPARRSTRADVSVPGMLYAAVARPPVVGGTVKSVDDTAAKAVPGVERDRADPRRAARLEVQAARRRGGGRHEHLGRDPGPRCAVIEWDDGPHALLQHRRLREGAARLGRQCARHAGAQPGRRRSGARRRGEGVHAANITQTHMVHAPMEPPAALASFADGKCEVWGCLQSPYGARVDVADFLGIDRGERHGPRHAPRRRLRAEVERRLRHRGGVSVARGRQAGARAVDPRGRHPAQLPPHHLGGADRDRPRRSEQAGRVAAPERSSPRSCRPSRPTRACSIRSRSAWGWRMSPSTSRTSAPSNARRCRIRGSAGTAPCRTSRAPSRSSRSWRSSPPISAATRRTFCSR